MWESSLLLAGREYENNSAIWRSTNYKENDEEEINNNNMTSSAKPICFLICSVAELEYKSAKGSFCRFVKDGTMLTEKEMEKAV